MAQIEQIKAEIERRIEELYTEYQELAKYEVWKTANDKKIAFQTLKSFLSFIESMEKEQPQGLHEAACEYAKEEWPESWYRYYSAADFKAGAKWAAEHGVSYDSTVIHGANNMLFVTALLDGKDFKEGDKVTVQIRKK